MFDPNLKPKYLIVDYGRRSYAFGLPWFSSDEDESPRKQALSLIKELGNSFDLYAERTGEYPQHTIASSQEGMKPGAISAASVIADMMPGSDGWLYVAEIENTIWITYGRDGLIMPEGDKIYTDLEEAKEAFRALNPSRFKTLVVPASWRDAGREGMENVQNLITSDVEESNTSDIFQKPQKTTARLTAISSTKTLLKAGVGLLILGVVGYLAMQLLTPTQDMPTPEEVARQAEILSNQRQAQLEEAYARLDADKPWQLQPDSSTMIERCVATLRAMPLQPAGYQMTEGECTNTSTIGTYNRLESYPSWLREWAQTNTTYQVNIDLETSNAFITLNQEGLPERGPENLTDFMSVLRLLRETDLLIEGTLVYTQPIQYTYEEYPDYIPLYGASDLTITTPQPEQWMRALGRVPGIAINTVRLDVADMTYTIQGQFYVGTR